MSLSKAERARIEADQKRAYENALGQVSPYVQQRLERNARKLRQQQHETALRAVSHAELLALEIPPREKIIDPCIDTQSINLIHSPRGQGKTWLGLYMAYAVASGGPLFDWSAPKPRGVLYVDGELPACLLQERIAHIARCVDHEPQAPLKFVTPDLQDRALPNLASRDGQQLMDKLINADTELLMFDNLSCLISTGEENAAESWQPLQTWALDLRKRGRSSIFFHHSGRNGLQRGTSRREDVLDVIIALRRPAGYSPEDGCVFEVHFEKGRGLYGDAVKPFEASLNQLADGRLTWTTRHLEKRIREQVMEMLADGMSQADIARELGVNRSTVSRHAKEQR
jgi:AAA domain/Homeodomain-like domain